MSKELSFTSVLVLALFIVFFAVTAFGSVLFLSKIDSKLSITSSTSTSYAIEPVHDDKLKVTCFMAKEISGNELISISCLPDLLILQSINVLTATNTANTTSTK